MFVHSVISPTYRFDTSRETAVMIHVQYGTTKTHRMWTLEGLLSICSADSRVVCRDRYSARLLLILSQQPQHDIVPEILGFIVSFIKTHPHPAPPLPAPPHLLLTPLRMSAPSLPHTPIG